MDYYQAVVTEYLAADRSVFVNAECCIQINEAENPDSSGPHWYADAIACDLRAKTVFLCEMSFSKSLDALIKRLAGWHDHWDGVKAALCRDSNLPSDWPVRPWLFVPDALVPRLIKGITTISKGMPPVFEPRITPLEMTQPWLYRSWNRVGEGSKPDTIPFEMQR